MRHIEDFTCDSCGVSVIGNGYTDHCPNCLYSKHVDKNIPGDRLSKCFGLMEPICIRIQNTNVQIKYRCTKCGKTSYCKVSEKDNWDKIIDISTRST